MASESSFQHRALFTTICVVAVAVVIDQPTPETMSFGSVPLYNLAKLEATYYTDAASCDLCKRGIALEKVWV